MVVSDHGVTSPSMMHIVQRPVNKVDGHVEGLLKKTELGVYLIWRMISIEDVNLKISLKEQMHYLNQPVNQNCAHTRCNCCPRKVQTGVNTQTTNTMLGQYDWLTHPFRKSFLMTLPASN